MKKLCGVFASLLLALVLSSSSFALDMGKIDLNTATQAQIESLPGVGASLAQKIMAARPLKSMEDLGKIKGMGSKAEKFKDQVTFGSGSAASTAPAAPVSAPEAKATAPVSATTNAATEAPAAQPAKKGGFLEMLLNKKKTAAAAAGTTAVAGAASDDDQADKKSGKAPELAPGEMINLNTASESDLQKLPGVGPKKAAAIIAGRPYATIEDVMKVKGIKQGLFAKMKDHITK